MGVNAPDIDFGNVEDVAGGLLQPSADLNEETKTKFAPNGWLAEPTNYEFSVAKTGTRQIRITFKVVDKEAVNTEGEPFNGTIKDSMYFTEKSAKVTKMKLKALGFDVQNLHVKDDDDILDLAEELTQNYTEVPVRLVTYKEEDRSEDGKFWARVRFINEVKV